MKVNILKKINETEGYVSKEDNSGASFVDKALFYSYSATIDDVEVIINSCPEASCFDIDLCDQKIKTGFLNMLNRNMEKLTKTLDGVLLNEGDLFQI